jgi:hypothetical protein
MQTVLNSWTPHCVLWCQGHINKIVVPELLENEQITVMFTGNIKLDNLDSLIQALEISDFKSGVR